MGVTVGRRLALLSVPLGYASLLSGQGQPVPLANDLQLFSFRWQSLFKIGWQWTLKGDVFPEFRVFDLNQQIPIHEASDEQQKAIESVVNDILDTNDVEIIHRKEAELDNMVLALYGISPEELDYFVVDPSKE